MAFRRTTSVESILQAASDEAARLGVEEYLIVVKRRGALMTVSDESELRSGDQYVGIVTDAKGGRQ